MQMASDRPGGSDNAPTFLTFLNARDRNPPSLFVAFDGESYRLGFVLGIVRLAFLNEYTMMFTGRDRTASYSHGSVTLAHPIGCILGVMFTLAKLS